MPFEKGVSGNPGGKPSHSAKLWRDALRVAVEEIDIKTKKTKLLRIAEKIADLAIAGDIQAAKEIGDRLDGKPRQEIDAVVEERRYVARIPEPAKDAETWLATRERLPDGAAIQ
jgi:hypothetical protein